MKGEHAYEANIHQLWNEIDEKRERLIEQRNEIMNTKPNTTTTAGATPESRVTIVNDLIDYLEQFDGDQPVCLTIEEASAYENPVTLEIYFERILPCQQPERNS